MSLYVPAKTTEDGGTHSTDQQQGETADDDNDDTGEICQSKAAASVINITIVKTNCHLLFLVIFK